MAKTNRGHGPPVRAAGKRSNLVIVRFDPDSAYRSTSGSGFGRKPKAWIPLAVASALVLTLAARLEAQASSVWDCREGTPRDAYGNCLRPSGSTGTRPVRSPPRQPANVPDPLVGSVVLTPDGAGLARSEAVSDLPRALSERRREVAVVDDPAAFESRVARYRSYGDDDTEARRKVWLRAIWMQWMIARDDDLLHRARQRESDLRSVIDLYHRSRAAPGSEAAALAASAQLYLVRDLAAEASTRAINVPRSPSTSAWVQVLVHAIELETGRTNELVGRFGEIATEYRVPALTVASLVEQGRTYERLARNILLVRFVVPTDMQRVLRSLDEAAREDILLQIEAQVIDVLDSRARPIECLAVRKYLSAVRLARAESVDDLYAYFARTRLRTYGDERLTECASPATGADPTFAPYTPGELTACPP